MMPDSEYAGQRYVDHPAPSVLMVLMLLLILAGMTVHVAHGRSVAALVINLVVMLILAFYLWAMFKTYYTLSPEGVHVQYGPWKRLHPWFEFQVASWRKGTFAERFGWPSITPVVRFTNAVQLSRKEGFPLYLTPSDPWTFLQKVTEFAPELARETIR